MKRPKLSKEVVVEGYIILCDGYVDNDYSELYATLEDAKEAVEDGVKSDDFGNYDEVTIHPVGKVASTASFDGIRWEDNDGV